MIYDSSTDSWTQLNPFPGGIRGYAYGVAVGSKAYIGFGSDSNSTVVGYDMLITLGHN